MATTADAPDRPSSRPPHAAGTPIPCCAGCAPICSRRSPRPSSRCCCSRCSRRRLVSFVQWGIWDAVWTVPGNDTSACRAARGIGACWAVIPEKYRFILFGTYPYDEQWRPALATLVFIALFYVSSRRCLLAQGAGADLGRGAVADRLPDVGRHFRPAPSCRRTAGADCR